MNLIELQKYISLGEEYKKYIFILPSPEMFTKMGTVRKKWLHKFFEQNNEAKDPIVLPKTGAALEEGIAIKVPNYGAFYLMSYRKVHVDMGDYIKALALYKKTMFAEISDDKLVLSDNNIFELKDCEIDAYNPIPYAY